MLHVSGIEHSCVCSCSNVAINAAASTPQQMVWVRKEMAKYYRTEQNKSAGDQVSKVVDDYWRGYLGCKALVYLRAINSCCNIESRSNFTLCNRMGQLR